jgi:hypothetical protein
MEGDKNKINIEKNNDNELASMTIYNKLKVPGIIKIGDYYYAFKEQLKSNKNLFTYRCRIFKCRVPIHISKDNLEKIENKNNTENIEYTLLKEHKCKVEKDNNISEIPEKCDTEKQIIKNAKDIILANPLAPLSYQKTKLNNVNIYLDDSKINHLINKVRNSIYPKNEEYLNNINNIRITFDEKVINSKNLPFCPINNKFVNISKNNRVEEYIIITSKFHLNFLAKVSYIFVDATFKIAPKNFYQVLNMLGYEEETNFTMPIAHVLMTNKSYLSYKKIFREIKDLIKQYNIDISFDRIIFKCDFEKSLLKSIREEFEKVKICGCFFHFIKSLWKKARNLGLTKKKSYRKYKNYSFFL